MKKIILLSSFVISVIFLVLMSKSSLQYDPTYSLLYFFLESIAFAYVGICITFGIVIRGYSNLKKIFYGVPIFMIKRTIKSKSRIFDNFLTSYIVCSGVNFWCLYFLSITPVSSILTKIFEFDFVQKQHLDFTIFNPEFFNKITNLELFVLFTIIGVIVVNILRFLYRRHDPPENKYPGANALLAFSYTMLAFMIIQGFMLYTEGKTSANELTSFSNTISTGFIFSALDIFAVAIVTVADTYLIKSFLNKSFSW